MALLEEEKMIVGIVGKIAAGKTTVAKFFEEKGFCRVSCSEPLIDLLTYKVSSYSWIPELPERREPTRENLLEFGRYLKEKYRGDILVKLAIDKKRNCKNIVIDGVRSREEIEAIKRWGGKMIYVEATPKTRFKRLMKRKASKDRDIKTFEDFMAIDEAEEKLYHTEELKNLADFVIVNEGSLKELKKKIEEIITELQ